MTGMITMTVGDICQTDRDCVEIGIPRCKNSGKMPICYNGRCSCYAKRPPVFTNRRHSPSSSTSNS